MSSSIGEGSAREAARWMVERARTARDAGLDSLSLGDHHAMAARYYQNTPMLGRLLAEWDDRPAGCLFLLPLWNPVLAAEHIGTLAAIAQGPFIVQTGLGSGDQQFAAMGRAGVHRGRLLDESVRVVKALLAGETVASEPFGFIDAVVGLIPTEPVEWWIGGHAPGAIDRAVQTGDAWYAGPVLTEDTARPLVDAYLDACEAAARSPRPILRKDVIVSTDGAEAHRLAAATLAGGYRGMTADQVVVGSPAEVAERLRPFAELGFTDVIARTMAVPQPAALESIELLGEVRHLLA